MKRHTLAAFAILAFVACSAPSAPSRSPGTRGPVVIHAVNVPDGGPDDRRVYYDRERPPPPPPQADAAPPPPDPNQRCIPNPRARTECDGKANFAYGPQPYVYCKGVAPDPNEEAKIYEQIRNSPCVCFDLIAVQKRRQMCSRIP